MKKRKNAKTQIVDLSTAPIVNVRNLQEYIEVQDLTITIKTLQKLRRDKLAAIRRKKYVRQK